MVDSEHVAYSIGDWVIGDWVMGYPSLTFNAKSSITQSPMVVRFVIFDLDGTLIDSRRDLADSANALLAEYGAEPLAEDEVGSMVGCGAATLVKRVLTARGVSAPIEEEALPRFLQAYDLRLTHHTRPYAGVDGVLANLQGRGVP